jgi:TolB-like protein/DNA-binding winged helix-turn-helix (wHTH) protein
MPTGNVDGAIQVGEWLVAPSLDSISRGGETHKLEPRTMRLLLCLANAAPEVVSVDRLLAEVWSGVVVGSTSVYQAVSQLRKLLGDTDPDPTYVVTVPRRGYRMIAAVRRVQAPDSPAPSTPTPVAMTRVITTAPQRKLLLVALLSATLIALMVAGALIWQRMPSAGSAINANSIAVLPFADMSEQKDQEYLSDGLSEELINLLSNVPDLRVPARTSSFYFKGKSENIKSIAQKLSVAHVLEGSVRKAGNHLRITAQLIRADNGYLLWSETYDRDLKDVFRVEDEIAGAVVAALTRKLKLAPIDQTSSRATANTEAYIQYLLGRQFYNLGGPDDVGRAVLAYRKAIELDPRYAAAYASLAYAEYWAAEPTGDITGYKRAQAAAESAVALAPQQSQGYAARGFLRTIYSWDWAGAQADYSKALAIDPSDASAQVGYADLLASLGRMPEAIAAARKGNELDPLSGQNWATLGFLLASIRNFAAADEAMRRALEILPESADVLVQSGFLQLLEGNGAGALETYRKIDLAEFRLAGIAVAEHSLGNAKESQSALDELMANGAQQATFHIATVYAYRGEKDKAIEWLERAYQRHSTYLNFIKWYPIFDSLRTDPRFKALLRKMNLPA